MDQKIKQKITDFIQTDEIRKKNIEMIMQMTDEQNAMANSLLIEIIEGRIMLFGPGSLMASIDPLEIEIDLSDLDKH